MTAKNPGLLWLVAVIGTFIWADAYSAATKSIAVLDFEILDDTRQYNRPEVNQAQDQRLVKITEALRRELSERGLYKVLDTAPFKDRIEAIKTGQTIYNCNGCDLEIAKLMGADLVASTWVQKVSNLIQNINISVRDVRTGKVLYTQSVDIRGNTDTSWLRGIHLLVDTIVDRNLQSK